MDNPTVLVVEPDPQLSENLSSFLQSRGYQCLRASSVEEALEPLAKNDFRFTLFDLTVGGGSPNSVPRLRRQGGSPGSIIGLVDATEDRDSDGLSLVVDAVVTKPFSEPQLDQVIQEVALTPSSLELTRVRRAMELWRSPKMRQVHGIIREAARVDITVLISGETGTGKELVARAIHDLSGRRAGPFVKVNCAAVSHELLESELFGREPGVLTGTRNAEVGKFEEAHRGTIFLDEIGDLHPGMQVRLLHVLQEGEFCRVGGRSTVKVDVRVIAASKEDLAATVDAKRFREDLYYRLNVIPIEVPPLRERVEDIPGLIDYFARVYSKLFRREGFVIPPSVGERLARQPYPGNVGQLENLVKRMVVLGDPFLTRVPGLEPEPPVEGAGSPPRNEAGPLPEASLKEIARTAALAAERDAIWAVLEHHAWNRVRAAKALRISYRALLYKMKQVGLTRERAFDGVVSSRNSVVNSRIGMDRSWKPK